VNTCNHEFQYVEQSYRRIKGEFKESTTKTWCLTCKYVSFRTLPPAFFTGGEGGYKVLRDDREKLKERMKNER